MLKHDTDKMVRSYFEWLKENTATKQLNENAVVVGLPFLDRHNDGLEIIVSRTDDNQFKLFDDGWILNDLEACGVRIDTPRRKNLLQKTINGFGVQLDDEGVMFTIASEKNFAQKKHSLIQAMLTVNDLYFTITPHVKSIFTNNVSKWLEKSNVPFTPEIKFTGKSGYDHKFDFVVAKFKHSPERIMKVINNPNKNTTLNFITSWEDVKQSRGRETTAYVVMNDQNTQIADTVLDALENYRIKAVPWSRREEFETELAV